MNHVAKHFYDTANIQYSEVRANIIQYLINICHIVDILYIDIESVKTFASAAGARQVLTRGRQCDGSIEVGRNPGFVFLGHQKLRREITSSV